MESKCPFRSTLSYCPSHPIVPQTGWTVPWNPSVHSDLPYPTVHPNPSVHSDLPYPTVHPILLYHGQDGQYDGTQVSIQIYHILLSIPSYCTADRMDSTMEFKCPFRSTIYYCPSHPIVPRTGWTVWWNSTVHSHLLSIPSYCTTVWWNPRVHLDLPYPTVHPILLYHGQDGQYDGIQVSIQIYCPSHSIVPWTVYGWYDRINGFI